MTNGKGGIIFRNDADGLMNGDRKSRNRRSSGGPGSGLPGGAGAWGGDAPGAGRGLPHRVCRRLLNPGWACLTLAVSGLWLQACMPWRPGSPREPGLAQVAGELARLVAPEGGEIAVLGLRDQAGRQTAATRLVDQYLRQALEQAGATLATDVEGHQDPWREGEAAPASQWENLEASRVIAGRLQTGTPWTYLRLLAIDRQSGRVIARGTRRLDQRRLDAEVARRGRHQETVSAGGEVQVDLHLLVLRSDSGWSQPAAIEEGGSLQQGDRLQIRFRTGTDCEVYAFLYSSQAEVAEVFAPRFVYAGRTHYGPGEDAWITLHRPDRAHTLYFIAAERLNEDREGLFEAMAELVEQGQAGGLTGMERLDRVLVEVLQREVEGDEEIGVVRGREGIERGETEDFILADGTPFASRPEKLKAAPVLVRAFTFAVP